MRRLSSSAIVLLLSSCSPANPEPVAVPPAPKPVASTQPPVVARTQAKWLFPDSGGRADAQLDLGARGVFQVGERGRRWLIAPNGEVTQASVLIPQPLVDVQEHAGKLVVIGLDGTVYEVKEPLGPPVTSHAPKKEAAEGEGPITHAAGKEAIFGLLRDGTFHRSLDFGVSWSDVKLPLRPGDEPVGLAANKRGEVMVLLHPQRVLLSVDDGATFVPLATPGIGAEGIERDGHDDLFLRGYGQERFAKLMPGPWRLQPVKDPPEPLASHVGKQKPNSHEVVHRQLAGSRLVTMLETSDDKFSKKSVAVSVAPLGQMPTAPFEIEPSLSRWSPVRVAGHEGTVVVAVYDQDADPPVTRIRRSADEGKTWELVGSLEGREKGQFHLAVGPNWIAVGELCNGKTKDCTPPQVKIGNKAWAPLDIAAKLQPQSFLFDAAKDRLLLLASRGDERVLLEGKISGGPLGIVDVELPRGQVSAATLDAKGDVRLVYASPTRLVKVTAGKTPSVGKPLHLPFHTYEIDLAGDRGYAHWGEKAWETLDGGEHWAEVAPGPSGNVRCTVIGCVEGGAVRMGWDLNAGDPSPLEASLTEPQDKPKTKPSTKPTSPAKQIALSCTVSGAWKKISGQQPRAGDTVFDGDVRFVSPIYGGFGDSDSMFVAKGSSAPQKISLLGAAPKLAESKTLRSWTHTSSAGIVAARYQFQLGKTASGGYNPVDVELGWYSTVRGKSGKVKLPKVPAFRVGRSSPSALAEVVDGGILFLPNNGDAQLHFITDAGKITLIPRPKTPDVYGVFDHAVKIGDRIVLASTMSGIHATLAATDDMGKTWNVSTWTLGHTSALTMLGGKPALFLREGWGVVEPHALLSFDTVTPDPPALVPIDMKKLDAATATLTACNAKSAGFLAEVMTGGETPYVSVTIDGKTDADKMDLSSEARVLRIGEGGAACVQSIVAAGSDISAVIAPSDMGHAWLLRAKDEGSEYRPLSCKAP